MKRILLFLLTVLALLIFLSTPSVLKGQTREDLHATWIATEQGFSNQQQVSHFIISYEGTDLVDVTLDKGEDSNAPKYYSNSNGIRLYCAGTNNHTGNTLTIAPLGGALINEIKYTYYKQGSNPYATVQCNPAEGFTPGLTPPNSSTPSVDIWKSENGSNKEVVITLKTPKQRVLRQLEVTVSRGSGETYTVTYNANDGTGTTYVDPNGPYLLGETVTVLPNTFIYAGHAFDNWMSSGHTYYPGNTFTISHDMTFDAQWIDLGNGIFDVLNTENVNTSIGSGTGYCDWRVECWTADLRSIYLGKSCRNEDAIQITNSTTGTSKYSGVVTNVSNGVADKVQVIWDPSTINGRTLQVFGRQTPYTSTSDLYNTNQGTLLGTIVCGTDTELDIDIELQGEYPYIGLRSANGAMYFDEIRILWDNVEIPSAIEFSPEALDLGGVVLNEQIVTEFVVSQDNIFGDIMLATTAGGLSVTSIGAESEPQTVTWTYTPTTPGAQTVTVTATSSWGEHVPVSKQLPITMTVLDPNAGLALHDVKDAFVTALNSNPSATQSVVISLAGVSGDSNSPVQVIGQHGQYLYLQDGLRGLLVFGTGAPELRTGDKFTGGTLMGTLVSYNGIVELKNFSFMNNVQTTNEALVPVSVTNITDLNSSINHIYEHRYVQMDNLNVTVNATNATNWTVIQPSVGSMPLYDRFSVGYAFKTHPETDIPFTVKGVYDPYYSSGANLYQIIPTDLDDIHTAVQAGTPTFNPVGGTANAPVSATNVTLTRADGTTMVYYVENNRSDRLESNGQVTINLSGPTIITAMGTRDFYTDSPRVMYYYDLPANVRSVTFMVNGQNVGVAHAQYYEQHFLLSPNQFPSVNDLSLFSFRGWSTSPIPSNATMVDMQSFDVPEGGATLYAVYGEASGYYYTRITSASEISAGEYVIVGNDGRYNYPLKNTATSGSPQAYTMSDLGLIESNQGVLAGDNLPSVIWTFTGTPSAMTVTSSANSNHHLYMLSDSPTSVRVGTTVQTWTVVEDNSQVEVFNLKSNENNRYLTLYNSLDWRAYDGSIMYESPRYPRLKLYKKLPDNSPNDPLYTRVFINEDGTGVTVQEEEITISGPSVIPSGSFLNMNGKLLNSSDAANFLIQDGAVLIPTPNNTTGIKATVKKNIIPYTANDNGWYFIASPVIESITPSEQNGLLANDFDLYLFDQSQAAEWRNYEAESFNTLNHKTGYLYANSDNTTLSFAGTLATSTEATSLAYDDNAIFKGFNLIGNPYPCNTTITNDFYIISGKTVILAESGRTIAPCEGVFVKATGENQTVTFNKSTSAKDSTPRKCIDLVVSQDKTTTDRARVRLGEGIGMEKFNLDEKHSQITLWQNGQDYAVAYADGVSEMPVSFAAAQDGTYTLSVENEGLDLDYLHLVDNMTGEEVDLLATPSYTFEGKAKDYASRFRLLFAPEEVGASTDSATFAYYDGSEWVIANTGEATLQVVDVMGRVLRSETLNGSATISLNQTPGVYMLRLVSSDSVKVQKIVVR